LIYPLPFDPADIARYGEEVGVPGPDTAAMSLARAIACSPGWERFPPCSVLVRSEPPALAIISELTETQQRELARQADALRGRFRSFRYVSYERAEAAVATLAAEIAPWLADPEWRGCHFLAIPRGGHVVLGMLTTLLDIPRERLQPPADARTPVVLVDDCALSGTRLREQLATLPAERVAFVHLYSSPALRAAVLAAEPRVRQCVVAGNLASLPCDLPCGLLDRPSQWTGLAERGYWLGRAEFVTFAWGEPDRMVGNPDGDGLLLGWKLLPPELCLKHRLLPSIPVVQQERGHPPFRPGPSAFFADVGDHVEIAGGHGGSLLRLTGVAADSWRLLVATGSLKATHDSLLDRYDVSAPDLERDLQRLTAELRALGLLETEGS
jgi:hypothetical protein